MTRETNDLNAEFEERYRITGEPVMRRIELKVIGADYGATSYTTRSQADRLHQMLQLEPGRSLLDIGSGAGWPGIYLGSQSGCLVILTDRPFQGLQAARARIAREGVDGSVAAASGDRLPFQNALFDAVTSSDVLC